MIKYINDKERYNFPEDIFYVKEKNITVSYNKRLIYSYDANLIKEKKEYLFLDFDYGKDENRISQGLLFEIYDDSNSVIEDLIVALKKAKKLKYGTEFIAYADILSPLNFNLNLTFNFSFKFFKFNKNLCDFYTYNDKQSFSMRLFIVFINMTIPWRSIIWAIKGDIKKTKHGWKSIHDEDYSSIE